MLRHVSSKTSGDFWDKNKVNAFVGHNFPDFIERWTRDTFRKVGYGLNATTLACLVGAAAVDVTSLCNFLPAAAVRTLSPSATGEWDSRI
jgi:hypothetical protein